MKRRGLFIFSPPRILTAVFSKRLPWLRVPSCFTIKVPPCLLSGLSSIRERRIWSMSCEDGWVAAWGVPLLRRMAWRRQIRDVLPWRMLWLPRIPCGRMGVRPPARRRPCHAPVTLPCPDCLAEGRNRSCSYYVSLSVLTGIYPLR